MNKSTEKTLGEFIKYLIFAGIVLMLITTTSAANNWRLVIASTADGVLWAKVVNESDKVIYCYIKGVNYTEFRVRAGAVSQWFEVSTPAPDWRCY